MTTPDRTRAQRSKRVGLVAVVAAALLAGPMAAPAFAVTAPPSTAVTPVAVEKDPEASTTDILGAPNASNIIESDKLLVRSNGQSDSSVYTVRKDDVPFPEGYNLGGGRLRDLHKNYPTATGHFVDAGSERVLGLHYGDLASSAVLAVSSETAELEQPTRGAQLTGVPAFGSTVQIALCDTAACSLDYLIGATSDQTAGDIARTSSTESGVGNPSVDWYVRQAADFFTHTFQFVNRLTGECLSVDGGLAATEACGFSQNDASSEQLWEISETGTITSVSGSGSLTWNGGDAFEVSPDSSTSFGFFPIEQTGGVLPTWSIPMPARDVSLPSDLATGDLDRGIDAEQQYGDEAAVAWVDENHALHATVLDYNAPLGLLATDVTGFAQGAVTGTVGVEIGDFDGDTHNDIAVVYQDADRAFQVAFISYKETGVATVLSSSTSPVFAVGVDVPMSTTYAVASGNFDGSGAAQLTVSYMARNARTATLEVASFGTGFAVKSTAKQQVPLPSGDGVTYDQTAISGCSSPTGAGSWCSLTHRLEPALLEVSPEAADYGRRQLVFAWANSIGKATDTYPTRLRVTSSTCYNAVRIVADSTGALQFEAMGSHCEQTGAPQDYDWNVWQPSTPQPFRDPIQLAPGAYSGRDADSGSAPVWRIASLRPPGGMNVVILDWDAPTKTLKASYSLLLLQRDAWGTMTAYDQDNTSLRLGAPLVVQLRSDSAPSLIAAAPPAHMDWLWDASAKRADFVNISAFPGTALSMSTTGTTSYDSKTSVDLSASIGMSAKVSVGETVSADAGFIKGSESVDVTAGLAGTVTIAKKNTKATTTTLEIKNSAKTVNDDILRLRTSSTTVYRYPVLGGGVTADGENPPCADACYTYYDIAVPSSALEVQGNTGGKSVADYQPTWLNGNILSYPMSRPAGSGEFGYGDPAGYSYVAADGTTQKAEGMLAHEDSTIGESEGSTELTIANSTKEGSTTSADATLQESLEFKQSVKAGVNVGLVKEQTRQSSDVSVEMNQAFGTTHIGSTTTSSSQSLKVSTTNATFGQYGFTTSYYYDAAGVPKVTHSVNIPTSDWWTRTYGKQSDAALNLPHAIYLDADAKLINQVPKFSTEFRRQEIRGFESLQPSEAGPEKAVPYDAAPRNGDDVTFSVPVHNFSLIEAGATTVEFFAVPVDSATRDRIGPPEQIGEAKVIADIPSRGIVTAYSDPWKAIGPTASGAQRDWNIFVVLNRTADPATEVHPFRSTKEGTMNAACPSIFGDDRFSNAADGTYDEKSGLLIDPMTGKAATTACGSNNQGYAPLTVMGPSDAASTLSASTASDAVAAAAVEPNVTLAGGGFRTSDESHLALTETSAVPELEEGTPVSGFVTVDADADSPAHQRVHIYDGLPEEGGTLIASTVLRGVGADGVGHAHFSYTPTGVGRHQLYQKLYGEVGAGSSDAQIVTVDVVAAEEEPTPGPTTSPTEPTTAPSPGAGGSGSGSDGDKGDGSATADGRLADTGWAPPLVMGLAVLALALGISIFGVTRRRLRLSRTRG